MLCGGRPAQHTHPHAPVSTDVHSHIPPRWVDLCVKTDFDEVLALNLRQRAILQGQHYDGNTGWKVHMFPSIGAHLLESHIPEDGRTHVLYMCKALNGELH